MNNQKKIFTSQANKTDEERRLEKEFVERQQLIENGKKQAEKEIKLQNELNSYNDHKEYLKNLADGKFKFQIDKKKINNFLDLEKIIMSRKDKDIIYHKGMAQDNKESMDEYEEEIKDIEKDHGAMIKKKDKRILKLRELLKGKTRKIKNYLMYFGILILFLSYTTCVTLPVAYEHFILFVSYLYPVLEYTGNLLLDIIFFIFGDIYILLATLVSIYIATAYYLEKWVIIDFDTSRRFRY